MFIDPVRLKTAPILITTIGYISASDLNPLQAYQIDDCKYQ